MQPRLWVAACVFSGSYFPLALILIVQDFDTSYLNNSLCFNVFDGSGRCVLPLKNPGLSISFFLASFIGLLCTFALLKITRVKRRFTITGSKHIPSEIINYTLPYIVSFMGVGYNEPNKFLGILIFLIWMFWITYKSGLIILNPVLIVMGWRMYEVSFIMEGKKAEHKSNVLSKKELFSGKKYTYALIQDVYIVKHEVGAENSNGIGRAERL